MSGLLLVGVIVALALLGSRLFVIVGVATAMCFLLFIGGEDQLMQLDRIVTKMESLTTKNVFLSIPFFIAAGAVMTKGGIATRLTDLARAIVGWVPGGMPLAAILACILFAAISGSSPVTLVAVGAVMFPALVQSGYPKDFSIGIITSAGSLGCMIPPAISMLIYAISVQSAAPVDPADLFFAGALPAILIAWLLGAYAVWVGASLPETKTAFDGVGGWRRPLLLGVYGISGLPGLWAVSWRSFDAAELWRAFKAAGWALTLPFIVLGGIYGGVFTPTEAGAVAFAAAVVISCWIHGDVPIRRLPAIMVEATTLIGSLILIIVLAFGLNDFLALIEAPAAIERWVQSADLNAWQFLLLVNIVLIVLGALMDSISATLVFAPMLAPVAVQHYGMDPIHFGIVFVVNMEIGYLAPPVATNLFVAAAIFRQPFGTVARAILPTLGIICAALVLVMYVPTISKGPLNLREGVAVYEAFPWEGKEVVEAPVVEEAAPTGTPMTLEEMMKQAKEQVDAEAQPAAPMTLEEMMKKAKEQVDAEEAAPTEELPQ